MTVKIVGIDHIVSRKNQKEYTICHCLFDAKAGYKGVCVDKVIVEGKYDYELNKVYTPVTSESLVQGKLVSRIINFKCD